MSPRNAPRDPNRRSATLAEALRSQAQREKTYREQALKMFPWICAHCGRELDGKRLHELTVHHKDHNHDNNPPDGSNWELLCIYCHDNEHARLLVADSYEKAAPDGPQGPTATHNPFAGLADMLKRKEQQGPPRVGSEGDA